MIEHGTHSAYVHLNCRCEPCRTAEKAFQQGYRQANRDRLNAYDRQAWRDSRLRDDHRKRLARHRAYDHHARDKEKQACERCGSDEAQLHHDDYDRPLEVRWLCASCHGVEHRKPNTARECGLL